MNNKNLFQWVFFFVSLSMLFFCDDKKMADMADLFFQDKAFEYVNHTGRFKNYLLSGFMTLMLSGPRLH